MPRAARRARRIPRDVRWRPSKLRELRWPQLRCSHLPPTSRFHQLLLKALGLIVSDQRVYQGRKFAIHDFAQLVKREPDAMVADAILREIVSADFFGAIARLDLSAAFRGDLVMLLLLVASFWSSKSDLRIDFLDFEMTLRR